ncbi:MAG: hypothetical protein JNM70_20350 [Anaerolineae bacterium]|nr:hypothetical protein [Anaerolineae bacterium]
MNRIRRFIVALLLGLLLATQIGPAAAGIPIRCGEGCVTNSATTPSGG